MSFKNKVYDILGITSEITRKRISTIIRAYRIIFWIYLGIIILYVILFGFLQNSTTQFLDRVFEKGFGISYSASLLEDLIFFSIIGLFLTIISTLYSTKRIEDHSFEERLEAIVNSSNLMNKNLAKEFLKTHLSSVLACNKKYFAKIVVKDYDEETKAYRLLVEINHRVTNMCSDHDFETADPFACVYPDARVKGKLGFISFLGSYDVNTGQEKNVLIPGDVIELDGPYKEKIDLNIPRDGELGWKMIFSIWSAIGPITDDKSWFFLTLDRYSQDVFLTIENGLENKTLKYDLRSWNDLKKIRTLLIERNVVFSKGRKEFDPGIELYPKDKLELYFYEPE